MIVGPPPEPDDPAEPLRLFFTGRRFIVCHRLPRVDHAIPGNW